MTHGFKLHCDIEIGPNNLEINWGPGNHFHLEELTSVTCSDDPAIEPPPPAPTSTPTSERGPAAATACQAQPSPSL